MSSHQNSSYCSVRTDELRGYARSQHYRNVEYLDFEQCNVGVVESKSKVLECNRSPSRVWHKSKGNAALAALLFCSILVPPDKHGPIHILLTLLF